MGTGYSEVINKQKLVKNYSSKTFGDQFKISLTRLAQVAHSHNFRRNIPTYSFITEYYVFQDVHAKPKYLTYSHILRNMSPYFHISV